MTQNHNTLNSNTEKKPFYKNPYIVAFVLGVFFLTFITPFLRHVPEPPPRLNEIPSYSLTNQEGVEFGSAQLNGTVYVANFIFTNCPSICPRITQATAELQRRFIEANVPVHIVSITVDPNTDTPERLKTYALQYGVNLSTWSFLTGQEEEIRSLVEQGFQLHLGDREDQPSNLYDIAHSAKLVLVDYEGFIRGYYDSDETGLDEIFHRAQHVINESQKKR